MLICGYTNLGLCGLQAAWNHSNNEKPHWSFEKVQKYRIKFYQYKIYTSNTRLCLCCSFFKWQRKSTAHRLFRLAQLVPLGWTNLTIKMSTHTNVKSVTHWGSFCKEGSNIVKWAVQSSTVGDWYPGFAQSAEYAPLASALAVHLWCFANHPFSTESYQMRLLPQIMPPKSNA